MPKITSTTRKAADKRKLNDLLIKNLQKQAKPYLVWDLKMGGLAIRVEPTAYKSWKAIYSFHSRPRWFHLGSVEKIGLADARKLAGRIMFQVAEGKDPQAERRADRGKGTFAELADRYLEVSKKKNKSWKQGRALVEKHLLPRWSKLQASDSARTEAIA